jgi:hypothetical protein
MAHGLEAMSDEPWEGATAQPHSAKHNVAAPACRRKLLIIPNTVLHKKSRPKAAFKFLILEAGARPAGNQKAWRTPKSKPVDEALGPVLEPFRA